MEEKNDTSPQQLDLIKEWQMHENINFCNCTVHNFFIGNNME